MELRVAHPTKCVDIERVEVFEGPAGALYGGLGAVGGYINTVLKRPRPNNRGEISATLGSYGLARTTIDVNRALNDDVSIRLNGALERNSTFRDNAGTDSWSIAPAITWNNRHGTSLTLLTEFNHSNRRGFDFGIPNIANYQQLSHSRYFGLRDGDYPGVAGDYGKNDIDAATLLFEHVLNDDRKLRLASHYSDAHQTSNQTFPDSTTANGNRLDYTAYSGADESSKQYSMQAEVLGNFSIASLQHSLLARIDYGYLEQGGKGSTALTKHSRLTGHVLRHLTRPGPPLQRCQGHR